MTGCGQIREVEDVQPGITVPEGWFATTEGDDSDRGWCVDYGEDRLAVLLREVFSSNLDLRIAEIRLQESRALLRQSRARRLPVVGLGAEAEWEVGPGGLDQDYEISVPVGYEVDLWGRIGNEVRAVELHLEAAELDLEAYRLALSAETAELFFELERVRAELDLLEAQKANAETFQELTQLRHAQGMANAIDVVQQRQVQEALRESLVRARFQERLVLSGIATLVGRSLGEVEVQGSGTLPDVKAMGMDGVPADLLVHRPDVRAARHRVVAADHRVEAALAERLPRLQLSASLAVQAMNVEELFSFLFFTVGGALAQPIFEGGRIQGRIDQQEAVRERQLLEFSAILLDAMAEVEVALARGQALEEIQEAQGRQLEAAREALDLAEVQYRAGILDYLRVLTALQSVQRLELAELDARRQLLSQRIQLCRAAGGHWPSQREEESDDGD